jgi:hypothetical protein
MERRLTEIEKELRSEPVELAQAYATALRRVVPGWRRVPLAEHAVMGDEHVRR